MIMKNPIYFILLLFILAGCIEPYNAKTDSIDSILVVEGIITSGTTQITLSKSVGLEESINQGLWQLRKAVVYVECDDGAIFNGTYAPDWMGHQYMIETGELNPDKKYRLVILLDGEEYQSNYISPAISPPVKASFKFDQNYLINLCVSTTGYENQPGYYLWSYQEDWETTATLYSDSVVIDYKTVYNDLNSSENRYYCWKKDSSRMLILGTTEKLIENTIREKTIQYFSCFDDRFSVLYRVKLSQNTMHKEGYDYFYNLKKNVEQTGSIFGTIPSEIMGNIKCVSNPKIPVIGYVDVSTTTYDEQYQNSDYYDPRNKGLAATACLMRLDTFDIKDPQPRPGSGSVIYAHEYGWMGIIISNIYISDNCVDCTKYGGTKRKPKNWPNNHQ